MLLLQQQRLSSFMPVFECQRLRCALVQLQKRVRCDDNGAAADGSALPEPVCVNTVALGRHSKRGDAQARHELLPWHPATRRHKAFSVEYICEAASLGVRVLVDAEDDTGSGGGGAASTRLLAALQHGMSET